MSSALTIAVVAGGISHERDISLRSGRRIAEALTGAGHRVLSQDADSNLLSSLTDLDVDVIWPVLHGASGEDGALRSLLTSVGVPFVGATGAAARLAWSKPTAKVLVSRAGITTPRSITLSRESVKELGAGSVLHTVLRTFDVPLVVKPASGGSAQGVTVVEDAEQLPAAMIEAYSYDNLALVEDFVAGTEVTVGIIDTGNGPTALPPVEIAPVEGRYTFEARYSAGETEFYVPSRLPEDQVGRVTESALAVHDILGLRHISRVDMIVDSQGTPWFLEVNVMPGLTETSSLPLAIAAAYLDLGETYAALARKAIDDGV